MNNEYSTIIKVHCTVGDQHNSIWIPLITNNFNYSIIYDVRYKSWVCCSAVQMNTSTPI